MLNLVDWLTSLGISKEKAESIAPDLSPAQKAIEEGVLRQEDYSRKMGEYNKLVADFTKNNDKLNADIAEFATLSAAEQAEATELRNQIEVAQEKAFKLQQKIDRYAQTNGIDPKTIIGDVEPPAAPVRQDPNAFDEKKFRGEVNGVVGGVAAYMLELQAALPEIAAEHERLTGERFDQRGFIAGIKADIAAKKTDNLDPMARWEKQYGIPEKRVAANTAQREADLKKAREEGRLEGLSQAALPGGAGTQTGEHNSPVFKTSNVVKGSVMQRPQPSTRLQGAISALSTGKYRGQGKTAA